MKTKTILTILIIFVLGFSRNASAQDFPYISLGGHTRNVTSVAFSADGQKLASGSNDSTIRLWDADTGQLRKTLREIDWVNSVAFSPDGKTLASGIDRFNNQLGLWDVETGELRQRLIGHTNYVKSVAFSPDGKTLASGSRDSTGRLWETNTGNQIRALTGHTGPVNSVAFSPDGKMLASGSEDGTASLWEASTGRFLHALIGHTRLSNRIANVDVNSVAFSPDGKTLATGGYDATVRLWETSTGNQIRVLTGHTNPVNSVAFSPDGNTLASGSQDSTIRLWEVSTGGTIRTLTRHTSSVTDVAFSPDGNTLASSAGNFIHLWEIPTVHVGITPATGVSPTVGEKLTVNISIVGGKGVSAYQVQLGFDETALRHVSSANGNYLPSGAFFIPPTVETNKVTLEATTLSGSSDGDGRLATVTFEAVANKKSFINLLDVVLTDSQGVTLHQLARHTSIEVLFPGDLNKDGIVNIQDLVLVALRFGQPIPADGTPADVNGDGQVNVLDLVKIAGLLGSSAAAPSAWEPGVAGTPTRADVEQWLSEARQLNLTDPTSQHGIVFLEQLLAALTPKETALLPNYPNPFNPETWIPYQLAAPADVALTIYDINGRVVRDLNFGHQRAGVYHSRPRAAYWDGKNEVGESVASGVYFYKLTAGDFSATRKMLIRK